MGHFSGGGVIEFPNQGTVPIVFLEPAALANAPDVVGEQPDRLDDVRRTGLHGVGAGEGRRARRIGGLGAGVVGRRQVVVHGGAGRMRGDLGAMSSISCDAVPVRSIVEHGHGGRGELELESSEGGLTTFRSDLQCQRRSRLRSSSTCTDDTVRIAW